MDIRQRPWVVAKSMEKQHKTLEHTVSTPNNTIFNKTRRLVSDSNITLSNEQITIC